MRSNRHRGHRLLTVAGFLSLLFLTAMRRRYRTGSRRVLGAVYDIIRLSGIG